MFNEPRTKIKNIYIPGQQLNEDEGFLNLQYFFWSK